MSDVRVITARYTGTCGKCKEPIAKGSQINYGGKGRTSHEACGPVDTAAPVNGYNRRSAYYGTNSRGRGKCEDAPCCGCCD